MRIHSSLGPGHRAKVRRAPCSKGFTLLEIMVVIVIIGILATVTLISFGVLGSDREMQDESERIWAVITQAKEETELQGMDVGMRIGLHGYDFLRYEPQQKGWVPVEDDSLLGVRELPEGLRFRLWLDGREVVLNESLQGSDDADSNDVDKEETPDHKSKKKISPPHVMVLSSGDISSFELQLEREGNDTRWRVASHPDNTVINEQVRENS